MLVGRRPKILSPAKAAYKGFTEVLVPIRVLLRLRQITLVAPARGPIVCRVLGWSKASLTIFLGRLDTDEVPQAPWAIFILNCDQEAAIPIKVNAMNERIVVRDPGEGGTVQEAQVHEERLAVAADVLSSFIAGLCSFCYEPDLENDEE